jgi:hypothetical protein
MGFFILYLIAGVVFAAIGGEMAKARNRDAAVWALLCFATGLLGIIVLAIVGDASPEASGSHSSPSNNQFGYVPRDKPTKSYDEKKWSALKEFDQDIAQAAEQVAKFGSQAEDRLATAYLAIGDKSLLNAMVGKLVAEEGAAVAERERLDAERKQRVTELQQKMSDQQLQLLADRERRARATFEQIQRDGMMLDGKKVVSAEMYISDLAHKQGWLKVVYENGREELRAGNSMELLKNAAS